MNPTPDETAVIKRARATCNTLKDEIAKQVVGLYPVIYHLLICLLSGGHALLVGVPGLAKTMLIRTLAQAMHLNFRRIQFTPDLMPADITGTNIIEEDQATGQRQFVFAQGPLFANVILADEINRAPPKTQAALLEAMQEHSVTVSGKTYVLEEPFFVLATQNPIEQEGTYPLPEAQLDRFMFNLLVEYPTVQEEIQILETTTVGEPAVIQPVVSGEEILQFQKTLRRIPVPRAAIEYAVRLLQATRPCSATASSEVKRFVRWGGGPRAAQQLVLAAKVRAVFEGRFHVEIEDLQALALPVLRHRILLNYHAEVEHLTPDALIGKLIAEVK
ncbi:MAG: MoxR family ATPase [Verrucomicrobiae bacterium]|nr:MoxR family ATPase [Verrucomicrobiae bacterium]